MEMYYTKREYNQMKNALTKENKSLRKQVEKLQKKVKELEYSKEVVFEPDFELTPTSVESFYIKKSLDNQSADTEEGIQLETDHIV